jgi:biopolymer transport protein TolR
MDLFFKTNLPLSEINVTPLVDVMLVLLVIFMITAPKLEQGVRVDLPEVTTAPLPLTTEELVLSITSDRKIYIDRYSVNIKDLKPKLELILKQRTDRSIYLRADKDVDYGLVVKALAEVRKAGVDTIGMVTEPERVKH